MFLLVATALLAPPSADGAMYWGGTIKGAVYGEASDAPRNQHVLQAFERDAGKRITFVNTGQAWASFDTATMQAALEAGAIPLVTMGLPQGVTLEEVAAGSQDAQIRAWAQQAKAWGYPFLFRPWWEMNGTWYRWRRDPSFVAAWRHFHDLVEEEGATNVTWAWIVNAIWWDPESDPSPYYPGDAYVDWVGMDAYNWGRNPIQPDRWATPEQTIGPTLDLLERIAPGKPVCICENASTEIGGNKESWIHEMLHSYLPRQPAIKAYLWFNWNIEQNGGRWDWPIESSATAQEAFREGIQSSVYLSSLPPLRPLAKVPLPSAPETPPESPPPANPPPPAGSWSQAEDVSPGGADAREADVAVAPGGRATVAWVQYDGSHHLVRERQFAPGGSPQGPIRELSAAGQDAFEPQVAVGPDGAATVIWKRFDGSADVVQEVRIGPDGSPQSAPHDLSAGGRYASRPQVAATSDGGAIAVWQRFSGYRTVVQERRIEPSGAPEGATHDLSDGQQNAVEPQVVAAPGGGATVVWDRFDGSDQIVQERRVSPAGPPEGETHDLSATGGSAVEPDLSVGPDGAVTIVWTRFDGEGQLVQERRLTSAGVPEPAVHDVSAPGEPSVEPEVATGPDGTTTIVWQGSEGSHQVVQERRVAANGSLDPAPQSLSPEGEDAHDPQVASAGGAATAIWDASDGSSTSIQARRVPSSGAPGSATVELSAGNENAGNASIDESRGGAAMAVWRRFDGSDDVVQAAALSPLPGQPQAAHTSAGAGAPPGSTRFRFGRVRPGRRGSATIPISIPGPGRMSIGARGAHVDILRGPGLSAASAHLAEIAAACTVIVRIVPSALTRRRLARDSRARIRLRARFAPTAGVSRARSLAVVLRASAG